MTQPRCVRQVGCLGGNALIGLKAITLRQRSIWSFRLLHGLGLRSFKALESNLLLVTRGLCLSRELTLNFSPLLVIVLILLKVYSESTFIGVVSLCTIGTCLDVQTAMAMRGVSILPEVSASDTNSPIHEFHPFVSSNAR